ncbi:MAG: DUF5663 domain-containing protein [Candidatus Microsaccharimonas sp.]
MYQDEQLIEQLGIGNLSEPQQEEILEHLNLRIGEAMSEGLTEQQITEYEAIINDDKAVIEAWLSQNAPNYKDSGVYQELAAGYDEDPEHINPEKVFASIAWTQVNSPNAQEVIARVIEDFKKELETSL